MSHTDQFTEAQLTGTRAHRAGERHRFYVTWGGETEHKPCLLTLTLGKLLTVRRPGSLPECACDGGREELPAKMALEKDEGT